MNYLATNGPAIAAWAGLIVLALLWVWAVDWCVVGIVRELHRRTLRARMGKILGRRP